MPPLNARLAPMLLTLLIYCNLLIKNTLQILPPLAAQSNFVLQFQFGTPLNLIREPPSSPYFRALIPARPTHSRTPFSPVPEPR